MEVKTLDRKASFYDVDNNLLGVVEMDNHSYYNISMSGAESAMSILRKLPYSESGDPLYFKKQIIGFVDKKIKKVVISEFGRDTENIFISEMEPFYEYTPALNGPLAPLTEEVTDYSLEEIKFLENTTTGIPHITNLVNR